MKTLITGGTGLLGYKLQQNCPPDITVTSIYHPDENPLQHELPFPAHPLDITNHAELTKLFKDFKPDVVIHTAAQGSLDWCEENEKEASNAQSADAETPPPIGRREETDGRSRGSDHARAPNSRGRGGPGQAEEFVGTR